MARDFERSTTSEAAELDAMLGADPSRWWDAFYQDRAKPCLLAQK